MLVSIYNVSYKQQCLQLCPKGRETTVRHSVVVPSIIIVTEFDNLLQKCRKLTASTSLHISVANNRYFQLGKCRCNFLQFLTFLRTFRRLLQIKI